MTLGHDTTSHLAALARAGAQQLALNGGTTESGAWRPDLPFNARDGIKITLRREPGITPKGFLEVPFRFQVGPTETIPRTWTYNWQTTPTIAAGEQATDGGKQLDRLSFSTMFLDLPEDFMVWTGSLDVQRMLTELRLLLEEPAPFRLTLGQTALWGPRPLVNTIAAFTSINPEQRGGYLGTEYTNVEFIQIGRERLSESARQRPSEAEQERRYTLRPNDTLYGIAELCYMKRSSYHIITKANGIAEVGAKGVAPDSSEALEDWAAIHNRKTLRVPGMQVRATNLGETSSSTGGVQ
jgi:hypothetical protein